MAFMDISGFKELMKNEDQAYDALDKFYRCGYSVLRRHKKVKGLFISDCGLLFVDDFGDSKNRLRSLLVVIREINKRMLDNNIMFTTSIAFGRFRCEKRLEFTGLEKNLIYGKAYVDAFLDNEKGEPKIQPGQCRIVKKGLPSNILDERDEILRLIKEDGNHYYFYWMVRDPSMIEIFKRKYK